ncbi:three-Cys-motif partner protein TcmP [Terriglobus sp.]|uniref:three-Cys-motif partner protein TcmP n=1 Tax=Terriglobus sp. TaxID=1889013 RepID=UPI003B00242F
MYDRIKTSDDGLETNEVGAWSYDKYALIEMYMSIFSRSMNGKWTTCFIDLYSGAGLSRVKNTNDFLKGSPLLALDVTVPFSRYIFCEEAGAKFEALSKRVQGRSNVTLVAGDCNASVAAIVRATPTDALSLCFVDPYDLSINMETLRAIAKHGKTDFLCLIASGMDAKRNVTNYEKPLSLKVERFLGRSDWRTQWEAAKARREEFDDFLAAEFARGMEGLGYLPTPRHQLKRMVNEKRATLYHLALFSKSPLAFKFWSEVLKYSSPNRGLFD